MSVRRSIHRRVSLRVAGWAHRVSRDDHVSGAVHRNGRCNVIAVVGANVALLPDEVAITDGVIISMTWPIIALRPDLVGEHRQVRKNEEPSVAESNCGDGKKGSGYSHSFVCHSIQRDSEGKRTNGMKVFLERIQIRQRRERREGEMRLWETQRRARSVWSAWSLLPLFDCITAA